MNQIKCEFQKSRKFELFHYAHIVIGKHFNFLKGTVSNCTFFVHKSDGFIKTQDEKSRGKEGGMEGRKERGGGRGRKGEKELSCISMHRNVP